MALDRAAVITSAPMFDVIPRNCRAPPAGLAAEARKSRTEFNACSLQPVSKACPASRRLHLKGGAMGRIEPGVGMGGAIAMSPLGAAGGRAQKLDLSKLIPNPCARRVRGRAERGRGGARVARARRSARASWAAAPRRATARPADGRATQRKLPETERGDRGAHAARAQHPLKTAPPPSPRRPRRRRSRAARRHRALRGAPRGPLRHAQGQDSPDAAPRLLRPVGFGGVAWAGVL
jgi:hypothetical protein